MYRSDTAAHRQKMPGEQKKYKWRFKWRGRREKKEKRNSANKVRKKRGREKAEVSAEEDVKTRASKEK